MSNQNPHLESPPQPTGEEAIQPTSPDFIETPEVPPLSAQREPMPIWLYLICGFALFMAGSSFTGLGNFSQGMLDQGAGGPAMTVHHDLTAQVATNPMDIGKALYGGNCANCHQGSGAGEPGSYPPLIASEWVMGSKERLAAIMLHGISGSLSVKGDTYSTQVMPGWAGNFTDEKMAAIMTYIRGTWGNTMSQVSADEVSKARAKFASHGDSPFTEAELMKIAPNGPDPSDKK
jgi:mono/diheme cytochrome c family protein